MLPAACSTVADIASIAPADVNGVDSIFDVKVVNLKLHYFVKWTGCDVGNNTWEPEDHIMDPTDLGHACAARVTKSNFLRCSVLRALASWEHNF
jgi:hypothetical protein